MNLKHTSSGSSSKRCSVLPVEMNYFCNKPVIYYLSYVRCAEQCRLSASLFMGKSLAMCTSHFMFVLLPLMNLVSKTAFAPCLETTGYGE
jgi:hypothetical protein